MNLLRDTSWDALRAFAEFAEDGNFTRAATRLHISQPALHTKIANLQKALRATLYERRNGRTEITETGRKLQRFAREIASAAADFQTELAGETGTEPIVLAAGEGCYLYLLGEAIRTHRSASAHPLRLQTADGVSAIEAVKSARAHLAVASLETPPAGLEFQPLTRVGQALAMPARHPLAARRSVKLADLEGAQLIVPPSGRPHRTLLSRMLQSAQVTWHVAVEASGWELMLQFVRLGLGLAIVNACCRMPAGVTSRPMPELPSLQYYVFHLDKALPKAVVELKKNLLDHGDAWKDSR